MPQCLLLSAVDLFVGGWAALVLPWSEPCAHLWPGPSDSGLTPVPFAPSRAAECDFPVLAVCLGNLGFPIFMGVWVEFRGRAPTPCSKTTTSKSVSGTSAVLCLLLFGGPGALPAESRPGRANQSPVPPAGPCVRGHGCGGSGQSRTHCGHWGFTRLGPRERPPCPGAWAQRGQLSVPASPAQQSLPG